MKNGKEKKTRKKMKNWKKGGVNTDLVASSRLLSSFKAFEI